MRMTALAVGAIALTALSAAAQEKKPSPAETKDVRVRMPGQAYSLAVNERVAIEAKTVTAAPYSAEVVKESIQVLSDGNRIVNRSTGRVYRDSQGRTRREEDGEPGHPVNIAITDPVADVSYALDPESRTAWRAPASAAYTIAVKLLKSDPGQVELKKRLEAELAEKVRTARIATDEDKVKLQKDIAKKQSMGKAANMTALKGRATAEEAVLKLKKETGWDERTETLPARHIEGVMAEGTRVTRTIPAGAIGNELPIVIVTEKWVSPELQVLVLTRTSDPRTGESTYKLQNIQRGEQSHSWFEVPADYTIKKPGFRKE